MARKYEKGTYRLACGGTPHSRKENMKTPAYCCVSCQNRSGDWCLFFNRHIIKDYNRCFHHSCYEPVALHFKAPDNLEELIEAEEIKIA